MGRLTQQLKWYGVECIDERRRLEEARTFICRSREERRDWKCGVYSLKDLEIERDDRAERSEGVEGGEVGEEGEGKKG